MSELIFANVLLFTFSLVIPYLGANIIFNNVTNYWKRSEYEQKILDRANIYVFNRLAIFLFLRTVPYLLPFTDYIIAFYIIGGILLILINVIRVNKK